MAPRKEADRQNLATSYYQSVFETVYDAILVETLDGQILDANPAACKLLGYTREELLSINVIQLIPPGYDDQYVKHIMQREIPAHQLSFISWNIRKDRTLVPVEVSLNSLEPNGQEIAIVGVRDITTRIEAEAKVKRQNLVLKSLHEMALGIMQQQQLLDVLKTILEYACKMISSSRGFIYMPAEEHDMLEIKVGLGYFADFVGYKAQFGQGVGGKVWLSGQSLIVENYQNWDGRLKNPCWTPLESIIGIPLKSQGSVVGVIGIDYSGQSQKFSRDDFFAFERLAELASIAINNAYLTEELRKSEARFHSLFSNMTEGVSLLEVLTDEASAPINYRIVDVNPEYEQIIGLKREDVVGRLVTEVYSTEELQFIKKRTQTALTRIPLHFDKYYDSIQKYLAISIMPWGVTGIACIFKDITEQKQAEEKLLYMSFRDVLTGVYNRTYFEAELKRLDNRRKGSVALVMIDVDGLKLVNDTFGHDEGDRLLVKTADFLSMCFRQEDIVTRIGGDEFAIVLKEVTAQEAEETSIRLRENLINLQKESAGCKVPLQLSIGYAFSPDPSIKSVEIFRLADKRMYRDKLHRRGNSRSMILQTLKQMLVERDYYTEKHAARLQDMVDRFARTLGRPESELSDLRLFAQFHDIGKVGISDRILQKPGPLSPKERSEMQRHCEIGQRIAQSSEDLRPIADWILMHHEHWDGGGYPLGLQGNNIPIECRIVNIVDAYDAMTSDRPYRKAMSQDAALAEIKRCAGTQFDPSLADFFIQMFPSL